MKTIKTLPVATVPGKLQSVGTPYEGHAFLEASSIRKDKKINIIWCIPANRAMNYVMH